MNRPTAAALLLVTAFGCSRRGPGGPQRVPVTIAHVEQRAVPFELQQTGSVEPRQTVNVESQVTGVLLRVAFREGDAVAAGQLLFQIDPDRKSTRLNSSHSSISYAVFCLKKKKT